MSDLSVAESNIAAFFKGLVAKAPTATQTQLQPVVTNLQAAENAAVAAIPALANTAVNLVLGALGPVGVGAEPFADAFLDEVITQLMAKKSTAAK